MRNKPKIRESIQKAIIADVQSVVTEKYNGEIKQAEMSELTVNFSVKYDLDEKQTEYMIRVVECEIPFILEMGAPIKRIA
jgi:phage tail tube protein FII